MKNDTRNKKGDTDDDDDDDDGRRSRVSRPSYHKAG